MRVLDKHLELPELITRTMNGKLYSFLLKSKALCSHNHKHCFSTSDYHCAC